MTESSMIYLQRFIFLFAAMTALVACSHQPNDSIVSYSVYSSTNQITSPVTSTLFYGQNEVMLIDAQLTKQDAQNIVHEIRQSGKPLTVIYISNSRPDFYFGLETILDAYPEAQVLATQATVDKISQSGAAQLTSWRAKLAEQAPRKLVIPTPITAEVIPFSGGEFVIKGNDPVHTYLWLPSKKLILASELLSNNMHIWAGDAKTTADRLAWDSTIIAMLNLQPTLVIPGHYLGEPPNSIEAIEFTHQYIRKLDYALLVSDSAQEAIDSMKASYPDLGAENNLQNSVKIILNGIN